MFFFFRFNGDVVSIMVKKNAPKHQSNRHHGFDDFNRKQPTFCLKLQMSYTKKHRIPQLEWKKYSVKKKTNLKIEKKKKSIEKCNHLLIFYF